MVEAWLLTGIIGPPFCVFTSFRYVPAAPRASVMMTSGWVASIAATSVRDDVRGVRLIGWLIAIVPPSMVNALVAGGTKGGEPMWFPKTSAAFVYGSCPGP